MVHGGDTGLVWLSCGELFHEVLYWPVFNEMASLS